MTTKILRREFETKGLDTAVMEQNKLIAHGWTIDSIEIGGVAEMFGKTDVWLKIKYSKEITIDEG